MAAFAVSTPGAVAESAAAQAPPPVIAYLQGQGMTVERRFSAPGGLTGYVGRTPDGHEVVFFVPPGGAVALFGAMMDAHGHNLTQGFVQHFVLSPHYSGYYAALEKMHWIAQGDPHPRRIVYAFIDPNCPYCWRFWQQAKTFFGHGVQVRYLIVAVLGGTSDAKAAAILAAKDPSRALDENENGFREHEGGIKPLQSIPPAIGKQIAEHNTMMRRFGFDGTPGLVWKDESGDIKASNGLPPPGELSSMFGTDSGNGGAGKESQSP